MQEFLSRARWDAGAARDDLQAYVVGHLADPGAVLVLDGWAAKPTGGFLEKGAKPAGVRRRRTGAAGRTGNAQAGVFPGCASPHGRALIGRALHVPDTWANDEARRREARIPAGVELATKPKQGLPVLGRARAVGVPFAWVAGDGAHGADSAVRRWAERHRRGCVLAVASGQRLATRPVTAWIEGLADAARGGASAQAAAPRVRACTTGRACPAPARRRALPARR